MAAANVPEYGGYDFTFTKPVPENFYCNICKKVLCDPHLMVCCTQNFCKSCLKCWFKKQKACPHCHRKNVNNVLNKVLKHEIDNLEIQCTKQGLGCQWVGELSSLQTHLDSDKGCGYVEVMHKCGTMIKRKELKAHLEQQCPLRKIQCQYCHYEGTYQTITSKHYDECPHYPLPCPNKCGALGIRRADMTNHRSICKLEPVECPFHEAGCKDNIVREEFHLHMNRNQQSHLLVLLRAFQESKAKLYITTLKLLETRKELEESKRKPTKQMTLKHIGDEVNLCLNDYSLYKHTNKVWYSTPFYFEGGYKLCLAVYANGKGAGAGTHVSVELLQMKGEHDDKLSWDKGSGCYKYQIRQRISIQVMAQSKRVHAADKDYHFCSACFTQLPPGEDLHVFKSLGRNAVREDKFIDHQSVEKMMVLNDTIALRIVFMKQ